MVQLKVLTREVGQELPRATPEQFGATRGQGLAAFGEAIQDTGKTIQAVADVRARAVAGQFDRALGLREAEIKSNVNNAENFEKEFNVARKELMEDFGKRPFINGLIFQQEAGLRADQRLIGLRSVQNDLIVKKGQLAMKENLTALGEKFARSDDPKLRALFLAQMGTEVANAVDSQYAFREAAASLVREGIHSGVVGAVSRLNNVDPIAAYQLVEENSDVLHQKEKAALQQSSITQYRQDLARDRSDERYEEQATEDERKARQAANAMSLAMKAALGDGITSDDLRAVMETGSTPGTQDGLTFERLTQFMTVVNQGGRLSLTNDPTAIREAMKWAYGEVPIPDRFENLEDALQGFMLEGRMTVDSMRSLTRESRDRRFQNVSETLEKVIERLIAIRPAKAAVAGKARVEFHEWVTQNPNATEQESFKKAEELWFRHNVYGLLNIVPHTAPNYFQFDNAGNIDIGASQSALGAQIQAIDEGRIVKGEDGYMTDEEQREAFLRLESEAAAQKDRGMFSTGGGR